MAQSPFVPSHTQASALVLNERIAFEKALNDVHMILHPHPLRLQTLHATRAAYLDALCLHTTLVLHAAECLRVGGLDKFAQSLVDLSQQQTFMLLKRWAWTTPLHAPMTILAFLKELENSGKVDIAKQTPTWSLIQQASKDPDPNCLAWLLDRTTMPKPDSAQQAGRLFHAFPIKGHIQQAIWMEGLRKALDTPQTLQYAASAFQPGYGYATESFPPQALATALFFLPLNRNTHTAVLSTLQAAGWSGHVIARWAVDVVGYPENQTV